MTPKKRKSINRKKRKSNNRKTFVCISCKRKFGGLSQSKTKVKPTTRQQREQERQRRLEQERQRRLEQERQRLERQRKKIQENQGGKQRFAYFFS